MRDTLKAPAFQLYPADFLSSPDVMLMTAHEVGAYCLLLFTAWLSEPQGFIENNEDRMRRIARLTVEQWTESRSVLLRKFPETEDKARRYNPRLVEVAEKQEAYRKKQQENGAKGGRPRNNPEDNPDKTSGLFLANPNESSLSLSLSLTPKQKNKARDAQPFVLPSWIDPDAWDGFEETRKQNRKKLTDRARALLISKLSDMRQRGIDPNGALRNSVMNGWTGVFEPNNQQRPAAPTPPAIKFTDPEAMNGI